MGGNSMVVERRWYAFTREDINKIPKNKIGVYLLGDKDKTIMRVGSSASENVGIHDRLISHLNSNKFPFVKYFKFAYADSPSEARSMEREAFNKYLRKNPQMLKYTKRIPRENSNWLF
jgi:hypothetical protein